LLLASLHFKQGNLEQAEELLFRFIKKYPGHLQAAKLLAAILIQQGRVQAAIDTLKELAPQAPMDLQLQALLGSAYLRGEAMSRGEPNSSSKQPNWHPRRQKY
jgi:predicted Zn-dependent protease